MSFRYPALASGIAVFSVLIAAAADAADPPANNAAVVEHSRELLQTPRRQVIGSPTGDVTLVEFFDYACPFCKAAEPRLEALVKADKNFRLVVKEFPILTPASMIASRAALAAARQGKYAAFHDALMLHTGGLDEAAIFGVAQDVGLDMARLRKDMADPAIEQEIAANLQLAKAVGVHGTPTFIIDGRILTQPSATIDFPALAAASRQAHAR